MKNLPVYIFVIAIISVLSPAMAVAKDCMDTAMTQDAINECAKVSFTQADKKLNKVYNDLIAKIDSDKDKASLKAAEKAWIKYRDAQCKFNIGDPEDGGSMYPGSLADCWLELTEQHTQILNEQLKCQEGDDSCRFHN